MKKTVILTSIFLITFSISVILLSYFLFGPIKLSTVELPNPGETYFIENIGHALEIKICISMIISTVVTIASAFIYSHNKNKK